MTNPAKQLADSHDVSAKVVQLLQGAHQAGARALQRTRERGLRATCTRRQGQSRVAVAGFRRCCAVRGRLLSALDPVLGHAAPARQQLPRARAAGIAAGPSLRLRDDHGWALAQAPGQLRAVAHRSAERHHGRSQSPSLRHHRPARRPRPRHRRFQGRFTGRRGAARRPSGVLRRLLPESRARVRRCSTCATPSASSCTACASCIRMPRSRPSSATARPAGRR